MAIAALSDIHWSICSLKDASQWTATTAGSDSRILTTNLLMRTPAEGTASRIVSALLRGAILVYRYTISPMLGPRCRYLPGCSEYAMEAIAVHGPFRGTMLAIRRISRCHPWGGSGLDPVPEK